MNITPTNGSLKFSWPVPSTNFVMQQSSDLQSWSDMTNQPVLNLTNLQDEVTLPAAMFFTGSRRREKRSRDRESNVEK